MIYHGTERMYTLSLHDALPIFPLEVREITEAPAEEDERADQRLRQVVRQRHAPDGGQKSLEPTQQVALHDQHDQRDVTERDKQDRKSTRLNSRRQIV